MSVMKEKKNMSCIIRNYKLVHGSAKKKSGEVLLIMICTCTGRARGNGRADWGLLYV